MKIPFKIEPTGPNSANVVVSNYHRNGWQFLSVRCPVEWKTDDAKPKLISLAKETLTDHIAKNSDVPYDNLR